MNGRESSLISSWPLILLAALISASTDLAAASSVQVLHRFRGASDGENPASNLIADKAGNFYGTTEYGGESGYYGTVFRLSPPAKPTDPWIETTLYTFGNHGDGARPTAGVIFGGAGDLYGTTSDSDAGGYGEVFQLSPPSQPGNPWTETVLYSFQGRNDGAYPYGGLISDSKGNLYGTTESSVFELSRPATEGDPWTFHLLHDFVCCTSDGWTSLGGLVRDSHGNLYGTTEWGGAYTGQYCDYLGCGTVFEVSPPAAPAGAWTERVLYAFGGEPDGLNPMSALTLDGAGNLYGNTYGGGAQSGGTVFQLSPPAQPGGAWTKTILHNFSYSATDGAVPTGALTFDSAGNLFGATRFGGNSCYFNGAEYGCGTVFELSPPNTEGGAWTENVLFFFATWLFGAKEPEAGLFMDGHGNLYGTTTYGGVSSCSGDGGVGCGTVFKVVR